MNTVSLLKSVSSSHDGTNFTILSSLWCQEIAQEKYPLPANRSHYHLEFYFSCSHPVHFLVMESARFSQYSCKVLLISPVVKNSPNYHVFVWFFTILSWILDFFFSLFGSSLSVWDAPVVFRTIYNIVEKAQITPCEGFPKPLHKFLCLKFAYKLVASKQYWSSPMIKMWCVTNINEIHKLNIYAETVANVFNLK